MISEFFKYCYANYRRFDWEGATLSEYFATDFEGFTVNDFNGISNNDRRHMRNFLRKRGVYVKKGRGIPISEALAELVQGELDWPNDDSENPALLSDGTRQNQPNTPPPRHPLRSPDGDEDEDRNANGNHNGAVSA